MKKIIALAAVFALVISLAACNTSVGNESTAPSQQAKPTVSPTEPKPTQTDPAPTDAPEFETIELADNKDITVRITGIVEDPVWGYTLKVFLENKTDLELMFTVEDVSVNGYMCDPFWAATVANGKKANDTISFSKSDFEKNGIASVDEITLTLRVYDNGDWMAEDLFEQTITINP